MSRGKEEGSEKKQDQPRTPKYEFSLVRRYASSLRLKGKEARPCAEIDPSVES